MNKESIGQRNPPSAQTRFEPNTFSRCARLGLATALGASLILCRNDGPQARQRGREPEVRVTGIAGNGRTVSIIADGSLDRAQTWQDEEGFHVVVVNGQSDLGGTTRGVKVRRVGNSLEMVLPVSRGGSVTVQPRGSRLDLVVQGGEERAAGAEQSVGGAPAAAPAGAARAESKGASPSQDRLRAIEARARRAGGAAEGGGALPGEPARREGGAEESRQQAGAAPRSEILNDSQTPAGAGLPPTPEAPTQVAAAVKTELQSTAAAVEVEGGAGLGSMILSLPTLVGALLLAIVGALLVFVRRRRRGEDEAVPARRAGVKAGASKAPAAGAESARQNKAERAAQADAPAAAPFIQDKGDRRKSSVSVPFDRRRKGQGAEDEATRNNKALGEGGQAAPAGPLPTVVFGAYRVDQEVARLVQGKTHSVEVISSRAAEDRRAVESSLRKALRSPETDRDGRRRARTALEDYGFVARSCATLLLGSESFDRASAASALGEMRSSQALPFLTEALYDPDVVVRAETVKSMGALGLPSAIGALLDTARRHPDLSADILQPALTACSVESLGLTLGQIGDGRWGVEGAEHDCEAADGSYEVEPAARYEELPEWVEDATLREALEFLTDGDSDVRVHCAQQLAQFQVGRAVEALNSLALHDADPSVRAAAVNSLGLINHESVFAPVVVSMADEAREVRAAAARSFSRLSFDRAEAYARVAATADSETLSGVARACVGSGLAAQALNRLTSDDPRQAQEAASLLTLILRAGDAGTVLEAIEGHRDVEVRVAGVRLLGMMNRVELIEGLRAQAERGGLHPRVRLALSELRAAGQEQTQAV